MTPLPWKRGLLSAALMLVVPPGLAGSPPVAAASPEAVCHTSIREAAVAGILAAAELGRRVEYGGAIFQYGTQCFVHSEPVTSNLPNRVEYVIQTARGRILLAGIYHTHTPGGHAREFSQHDRAEQKRLGVASYVGAMSARGGGPTILSLGEAGAARGQ